MRLQQVAIDYNWLKFTAFTETVAKHCNYLYLFNYSYKELFTAICSADGTPIGFVYRRK
jgi:hypothetical protein